MRLQRHVSGWVGSRKNVLHLLGHHTLVLTENVLHRLGHALCPSTDQWSQNNISRVSDNTKTCPLFNAENVVLSHNRDFLITEYGEASYHGAYNSLSTMVTARFRVEDSLFDV